MYPPPYAAAGRGPTYKVDFGWIGESWSYLGNAAGVWVGSLVLYCLAFLAVIGLISEIFPKTPGSPSAFGSAKTTQGDISDLGGIVLLVVLWVGTAYMCASYSRTAVKQVRGEQIDLGDAFSGGPWIGQFLLLSFVTFLCVTVGLIGLLFGAFFAFALLMPAGALLADGESFGAAVTRAVDGVRRDWFAAGLFSFVLWLLMELSSLCLLGSLATTPMFFIITALMYRDMVGMPGLAAAAPVYGAPQAGVWPPPPSTGALPPNGPQGYPPQSGHTGAWPPPQPGVWPPPQSGPQPGAWPPPQSGPQPGGWPPPQNGPQSGGWPPPEA